MAHTPELPDYEPLTKPRSTRGADPDTRGEASPARRSRFSSEDLPTEAGTEPEEFNVRRRTPLTAATPGSQDYKKATGKPTTIGTFPAITSPDTLSATKDQSTGRRILKRGHGLSFIGLFLFTFLVYFRPYEWLPSWFWLTRSAFWVAVFTVLVFVPTQLGLENKLTIWEREVKLVLLLLLAAFLSIPLALEPLRAWNDFTNFLKVVLVFIVMVNVVRTELRLKMLLVLVLSASFVLSLAAINDYQAGNLALEGQRIKGVLGGLFDNPNDLALHLVTIAPLAVALLFGSRNPMKKLFYALSAVSMIGGLMVTFSRAGFLGLLCAAAVLCWRLARHYKFITVAGLAIALLAFVLLAPAGYGGRLATTRDGSIAGRTDNLKRSIFIAARHPVFGVGMGNYVLYSNTSQSTHNAYTQVAAELGLGAMLVYIMLLVVPLKQLRGIQRSMSEAGNRSRFYYLAIGLEASLVGYMVGSFFASVAFQWYAYYLVAYAVCLRRLFDPSVVGERVRSSDDYPSRAGRPQVSDVRI